MRQLIAIVLGTIVLSACSSGGSATSSPIASGPSSEAPSLVPTFLPPITASPAAAPSPAPSSDTTAVDLANVESQPIATRAPASRCAAEDLAAHNLDRAMTLAGAPISFQFQSASPRDGSASGWSDGVPAAPIRFDASEAPQTVDTREGDVVRLEPASTITLIDGRLELYRLDADDHAGDRSPVATSDLGGNAKGLDIPLPTQTGRWLLSTYAHWQTDCASGDGYVDLLLITT